MLMDMFFEAAPTACKRRVHFHVFMAEVHHLMNAWRSGTPASRRARFGHGRGDDPIPPLADLIVKGARLLCFDELQVTDIADAMILGRLFAALFERGVTLVSTSNRPPDDLYRDGINRQLFLPFIALLKARMEIAEIAGPVDYRGLDGRRRQAWLSPIDADNERTFDALWLKALDGAPETGVTLEVLGRREHWPRAAGERLRAHFASLCAHALGPEDYLAIAGRFRVVFLEAVPKLGPEKRNEAAALRDPDRHPLRGPRPACRPRGRESPTRCTRTATSPSNSSARPRAWRKCARRSGSRRPNRRPARSPRLRCRGSATATRRAPLWAASRRSAPRPPAPHRSPPDRAP